MNWFALVVVAAGLRGYAFTTLTSAAALALGTTAVITAWDDATNLNVQVNLGAVNSVARPAVSAGTAGFTRGKNNGTANGFTNGNLYAAVYRQTSLTDDERANTQRYVAREAGVAL